MRQRYEGGGYSFNMDLPDGLTGVLKSFDMYVAVEGCDAVNRDVCGKDVENAYNNLALILSCTGNTGETASAYFVAQYPGIPHSNVRDDAQVPVLTRFVWVQNSGSIIFGHNGSGYPVLSGCTNASNDAALVPISAAGSTHSGTTVKLLGNAAGAPYFVGYDSLGTPPTLTAVAVASSNASTTLAKVGDIVTLTFSTDMSIQTPVVTIAGRTASVATTTGNNFTASTTMQAGDTEGPVPFTIVTTNQLGDAGFTTSTTTDSSAVTFDKTAPTITITAGPAGGSVSTSSPTAFSFTVDSDSTTTCAFDGLATSTCSGSVSQALGDGAHTFAIVATDHAGNTTSTTTAFMLDTTPPTLAITHGPAGGATVATSSVSFAFTSDADTVQCSYDGAATSTCESPFATTSADGAHTFVLSATDSNGNTTYLSRLFTVDTAPAPVVAATSGSNGPPAANQPAPAKQPASATLPSPTPAPAPAQVSGQKSSDLLSEPQPGSAGQTFVQTPVPTPNPPVAIKDRAIVPDPGQQAAAAATIPGPSHPLSPWLLLTLPVAGGLWLGWRKFLGIQ